MQVFEYQTLHIGEAGFEAHHWERLVAWQDSLPTHKPNKYFGVGRGSVTFKQFVGAIQIGDLTIEILPKIDSETQQNTQKVLMQMLQICRKMPVENTESALLAYQSLTVLEMYIELFLKELENILHKGLLKRYKNTEGNLHTLKGKLIFQKHLAYNVAHQERCYTAHQVYDRENLPNQLLYKALYTVARLTQNPLLTDRLQRVQARFPTMPDIRVNPQTFLHIPKTRQLHAYQNALKLAKMILLNFSPDVRGGKQDVWAMLFDMNRLFEQYIAQNMHQNGSEQYTIDTQVKRVFWRNQFGKQLTIRPDIVLACPQKGAQIILDTKWKILPADKPLSADVYQMFAYCKHFKAPQGYLVYPTAGKSRFVEGYIMKPAQAIQCGLWFVNLVDAQGNLRRDIGAELFTYGKVQASPQG